MIYNETAKEIYTDKQERIKPKSSSNHKQKLRKELKKMEKYLKN